MTTLPEVAGSTLTPQEQRFVELLATEGLSIPAAAAHRDVAVARSTGYRWSERPDIQDAVRAILSGTRELNQRTARGKLTKAWETIEDAFTNPNVTPTQLKAAMFTVLQSNGNEKLTNDGVSLHVEINTQLNTNGLAEQQARHSNKQPIEAGFELVDE